MSCKACNKVPNSTESDDCFEKALDVLKEHYAYYKNALQQRDLELQQVKERNIKLNKALQLLQKDQRPIKRLKTQHGGSDSWIRNTSSQEDCVTSELSLTDDEHIAVTNLNIALNSEQLFDTSALSQTKNDVSTTSSEIVRTPSVKESPKRNKQLDAMRYLKGHKNKSLRRSKSEWHTKERCSPVEKSWATKFLQPTQTKSPNENFFGERKQITDKHLCLSLKKSNPAKIKQSLLSFNISKDGSFGESEDIGEDIIADTPAIVNKSRSWAHRSGHNFNNRSNSITIPTKENDICNKSLDEIVFDFSPSKKEDLSLSSPKKCEPKQLIFDRDSSKGCISLPNKNLGISTNKSDSCSVVALTPSPQDIIFVEDSEIDTMDLWADLMKPDNTNNLKTLMEYESKCIQNEKKNKETDLFKKPTLISKTVVKNSSLLAKIKQETITREVSVVREPKKKTEVEKEKPSSSKMTNIHQNPLLSSDKQDTEDDDFMPKPFIIKQEAESFKPTKKKSIKERFNIDCEDCEKLINFFDDRLTNDQIQQHLDKCKRHNNPEIMHQNTPKDFWNPFILSFPADDPRNEVLIDNRFVDK